MAGILVLTSIYHSNNSVAGTMVFISIYHFRKGDRQVVGLRVQSSPTSVNTIVSNLTLYDVILASNVDSDTQLEVKKIDITSCKLSETYMSTVT